MMLTAQVIQRPIFRNTHVHDYGRWLEMNQQVLVDYFNRLITSDGIGPLGEEDLFIFTRIQHERELDTRDEYKRCYGSKGDQL